MPGRKCPTVRSSGTTSVRSALMPTLITSRASMDCPGKISLSSRRTPGPITTSARGCGPRGPHPLTQQTLVVMGPRFRGDDGESLLLRRGGALNKGLAALHLVGERRFVDLDHDRIGIDAEVFHQRLRDVAHHAGLLVIGAAGGHADGNFRHCCHSLFSCYLPRTQSSS